jgi:4-amino-4-deoxy-L-arabinose transferase-like glycosyltransferase
MDDVDAAESLQAKNMLLSGDWVTQRLNGTLYLDKAPLKYWLTAGLFRVLGIHDWVARLPTAVAAILLCWLVTRLGGYYAGLVLATSIGLFIFTRTVIPDIILTLFIMLSLWCFYRLLETSKPSFPWAMGMYAAMACAVLTKGLIGVLLPVGIAAVYLLVTRSAPLNRLYLVPGILLFLAIATPWHIMAILRNPAVPGGKFRGFFWFYFINEQFLRFLNQRWPRDYNTVPRLWFWLYHVLWFFPWTLALPAVLRLTFTRLRVLAACWFAVVMLFFTFSTTQEYYSMPAYPAIAILLGSAMEMESKRLKTAGIFLLAAALLIAIILMRVWSLPTPGDIYLALAQHPDLYTLSLGHMADLTLPAFAYLRLPLEVAGLAFLLGGAAVMFFPARRAPIVIALTLIVFFQAARLALVVFDPYLSSYAVARKLNELPQGTLIICGKYNPLSSVFYYHQDRALQNDADLDILEYGSLAPGAPKISVTDSEMKRVWKSRSRVYILAKARKLPHIHEILGNLDSHLVFHSADKYLFAN